MEVVGKFNASAIKAQSAGPPGSGSEAAWRKDAGSSASFPLATLAWDGCAEGEPKGTSRGHRPLLLLLLLLFPLPPTQPPRRHATPQLAPQITRASIPRLALTRTMVHGARTQRWPSTASLATKRGSNRARHPLQLQQETARILSTEHDKTWQEDATHRSGNCRPPTKAPSTVQIVARNAYFR